MPASYSYLDITGDLIVLERHVQTIKDLFGSPENVIVVTGKTNIPEQCRQVLLHRCMEDDDKRFLRLLRELVKQGIPFDAMEAITRHQYIARFNKHLNYQWEQYPVYEPEVAPIPRTWVNQDEYWCRYQTEKLLE